MNYPEQAGYVKGSATSFAAAVNVEKNKLTREQQIYTALKNKPRTRWELVDDLGLPYETVNPRCSEMKMRGLLRETGETREGRYGNQSEVLCVAALYSKKTADQQKKSCATKLTESNLDALRQVQAFFTMGRPDLAETKFRQIAKDIDL